MARSADPTDVLIPYEVGGNLLSPFSDAFRVNLLRRQVDEIASQINRLAKNGPAGGRVFCLRRRFFVNEQRSGRKRVVSAFGFQ